METSLFYFFVFFVLRICHAGLIAHSGTKRSVQQVEGLKSLSLLVPLCSASGGQFTLAYEDE